MADKKAIIIVKGDTTGFGGRKLLTINCSSEVWDLTQLKAKWILHGLEQVFNDLTQPLEINYTKEQTEAFPLGDDYGILRFETQSGERVTADNTIPVKVINYVSGNAIATDAYTLDLEIKDGDEVVMTVLVEAAVTLELGPVETLPSGSAAYAQNIGTENHQKWKLGIPQGEKGDQGEPGQNGADGKDGKDGKDGVDGAPATIRVGTTTTGEPGTDAEVKNSGTSSEAVFDFKIPKGEKGDQGEPGASMEAVVVNSLPSVGETGKIYLVPKQTPAQEDVYEEWIWAVVSQPSTYGWEHIGTTEIDLSGYEKTENKVTSLSNQSTDTQYPSAKCVYDELGGKQDTISDLNSIRSGASAGATALQPNTAITGATKCKITFDSHGLVTGGEDLSESDIPALSAYEPKGTVVSLSATDSITLADNTTYNGGTQTSLTIALPSTITVAFLSQVIFTSGATATSISFPDEINWRGDDLTYDSVLQKRVFEPVANKRYTIVFTNDGNTTNGFVVGV